MRIERIEISPLSVPLLEPFVIATGRVDATRAVLVRATVIDDRGRREHGLGEAAALPPVTREDQPELLAQLAAAVNALVNVSFETREAITALLDHVFVDQPVARAGMECALLDAWSRHHDVPLCTWLSGATPITLTTDMTLPIGEPSHMAELAAGYRARGFQVFKVKVGKSLDDDLRALSLIASRVSDARFRLDANEGFTADEALRVLDAMADAKIIVECFEQPCRRDDLAGMARVTAHSEVPVVADESVRTLADLETVHRARAARGVNLKLVKFGGLLHALAIGKRARELAMSVMCGGMVETRLGMTAMGHVACALGGVDYVDLDTAFLLASDPFVGGYVSQGAELSFIREPGLGLVLAR